MFTDWSHLTQGLPLYSCLQFQLSVTAFLCLLSLPHRLCFSLLQLLTPTLSFFLFFLDQNIEAKRQEKRDHFSNGLLTPRLPTIRHGVPQNNSSEGMLLICPDHCFPPGHPARLYFPGSFAVRWSHLTELWPMEHGSVMGLEAGCRNLVNSRALEDVEATKLEASWAPESPFGRKLLRRSIQPWTPVLDCFRSKITYYFNPSKRWCLCYNSETGTLKWGAAMT